MDDRGGDKPRDALARVYRCRLARVARSAPHRHPSGEHAQMMLDRVDRLMQAQVSREMGRASRNLGVLATVAASAPFIGLFGTVWGIMNAFTNIAAATANQSRGRGARHRRSAVRDGAWPRRRYSGGYFLQQVLGDLDRFGDRLETFSDEVAARLSRRLSERADGRALRPRRARSRGSRRRGRLSEINVTPFVDVMLVLLIVFMVTAPLLTVGIPIELPRTEAKQSPAKPSRSRSPFATTA
jgi:hypothetical protein